MNKRLALVLCAAAAIAVPLSNTALAQAESQQEPQNEKLVVGDDAPALSIGEWVKGKPVEKFEPGKIYVVEFWATWCGPCIAGMPHLSAMQEKYQDKVKIIGVNIWDKPENVAPFMKDRGGDKRMRYTVAIEKKIEGADASRTGEMDRAWMKPAGRNGIPSAFVIDGEGKIAYIGHPMWLDIPIEGLLAGDWDAKKGEEKIAEANAMLGKIDEGTIEERLEAFDAFEEKYPGVAHQGMFASARFGMLIEAGRFEDAWRVGGQIVDAAIKDEDVQALNEVAWTIVNPDSKIAERNLPLALRAARAANTASGEQDPAILDTLARVYWWMGEKSHAIELQRKAVENAEGAMLAGVQKTLEEYEAAMKVGG